MILQTLYGCNFSYSSVFAIGTRITFTIRGGSKVVVKFTDNINSIDSDSYSKWTTSYELCADTSKLPALKPEDIYQLVYNVCSLAHIKLDEAKTSDDAYRLLTLHIQRVKSYIVPSSCIMYTVNEQVSYNGGRDITDHCYKTICIVVRMQPTVVVSHIDTALPYGCTATIIGTSDLLLITIKNQDMPNYLGTYGCRLIEDAIKIIPQHLLELLNSQTSVNKLNQLEGQLYIRLQHLEPKQRQYFNRLWKNTDNMYGIQYPCNYIGSLLYRTYFTKKQVLLYRLLKEACNGIATTLFGVINEKLN